MEDWIYRLEPYTGPKSKKSCPNCGKKNHYSRYIDIEKEEYLPFEFGRCENAIKCGYWRDPYKEKYWENQNWQTTRLPKEKAKVKPPPSKELSPSFFDFSYVIRSMTRYENNSFTKYLFNLFGIEKCKELIEKYYIGSSKHWNNIGATIFWQVDFWGKVRTGKVMGYNPISGKRIQEPFNHVNWAHKVLNLPEFNLKQCYFGEHLLRESINKPVAIVESEKTAIIASAYFPEFVWIASGSLNNITLEKSEYLFQRDIILFPDLSENGRAFSMWDEKAEKLKEIASSVEIFDILEKLASEDEKKNGDDIVDFLAKLSLEEWCKIGDSPTIETIVLNEYGYPASWDNINKPKQLLFPETKLQNFKIKHPLLNGLINQFSLVEI